MGAALNIKACVPAIQNPFPIKSNCQIQPEIPTFTNKELVAFGESYAREQECVLDEMAVLALYNQIGNRQTSDHLVFRVMAWDS